MNPDVMTVLLNTNYNYSFGQDPSLVSIVNKNGSKLTRNEFVRCYQKLRTPMSEISNYDGGSIDLNTNNASFYFSWSKKPDNPVYEYVISLIG
jgi:hypothetical protein